MNDNSKVIDQDGAEVLDPRKALEEQTLAVDLARVEIDQQIATAHKFPRSIDVVMKKISTLAIYNRDSAENCIYALPRGGKPIVGPSIGFANIVMQAWGNCRVGARIVYIDRAQKTVICEGGFLDLETNAQSIVPVQRRIVDKHGRIYNDDMIMVTGMAAASIARRNAILNGVSRGLWHPIWLEAFEAVRGTVKTFAENKDAAFKALAQFGLTPEKIVMILGLKGEADMTYDQIPTMRGMYVALRDGSTTVEDLLDPRKQTGQNFDQVADPLGEQQQTDDEPAAPGETASQSTKAAQPAAAAAETVKDSSPPKDAQASAPASQEATQTQPKPAASTTPTTPEGYIEHWRSVCAAAKTVAEVRNAHSAGRKERVKFGLNEDQLAEITSIKDARISELAQ